MVVADWATRSGQFRLGRSCIRSRAIVLGVLLAALCVLPGVAAASAQAASLTGWLGGGAAFPNRALVLIPPVGPSVNALDRARDRERHGRARTVGHAELAGRSG